MSCGQMLKRAVHLENVCADNYCFLIGKDQIARLLFFHDMIVIGFYYCLEILYSCSNWKANSLKFTHHLNTVSSLITFNLWNRVPLRAKCQRIYSVLINLNSFPAPLFRIVAPTKYWKCFPYRPPHIRNFNLNKYSESYSKTFGILLDDRQLNPFRVNDCENFLNFE